MFFSTPKSRLRDLQHFLHKKYKYNSDLLGQKRLDDYLLLEADVKAALHGFHSAADLDAQYKDFEIRTLKLFPKEQDAEWKENVEVLFVAVVIALALRTFFLQPFVIPTDSMKPTLWGIPVEQSSVQPPPIWTRIYEFLLYGTTYVYQEIPKGGLVKEISDTGPLGIDLLGYIPFVDRTRLVVGDQTYILDGTPNELEKGAHLKLDPRFPAHIEIPDGTVINYVFGAGDHVFVNKFIFNFRKPQRGDVFVFTTQDIRRIQQGLTDGIKSQFYIKRCVGLPGDELQTKPPYLYSNGKILEPKPIFQKIYSMKDGYLGYSVGDPQMLYLRTPADKYQVPKNSYWAMGDNSYHSFDSRFWGPVPAENLVGTGLLVYWPFSSRWGLIH